MNGSPPLVSIGIPTYRRAAGLERTLRCIVGQTYRNLEIIVSHNGPAEADVRDVMARACAEDGRIRFHEQRENIGIFANFKFVLEQAEGSHFMWAADDDQWEADFIEVLLPKTRLGNSAMCNFETIYWADGRVDQNRIPTLSVENDDERNVLAFIDLMTPTFFYGLHHTDAIRFVLNEPYFDFYDCYACIRLILTSGFETIESIHYRAGIETVEYEKKYADGRRLNYGPFIRRVVMVVMRSRLAWRTKWAVLRHFLRVVEGLVRHHERLPDGWRRMIRDALRF